MRIKPFPITNSSSSGFVVAWPKKIKVIEDVTVYICGNRKADVVFKDSMNQKAIKIKKTSHLLNKIAKELGTGYVNEEPYDKRLKKFLERHSITEKEFSDNISWRSLFWDEYRRYTRTIAKKQALQFIEDNMGSYCYIYSYADGDGDLHSELEHGGTFRRLSHLTINRH